MTERKNAIEILKCGSPEHIVSGLPTCTMTYHGCNHEGIPVAVTTVQWVRNGRISEAQSDMDFDLIDNGSD